MAEPGGGRTDLDGHWSCQKCVLRWELLGWRPCAAKMPGEVTDGVTLRRAQVALAILVGHRTTLRRRALFPDGWYALHVGPLGESEASDDSVFEWPEAPEEKNLPHQAVVGLLCLQRESARVAISGDWRGPEQRYKITKTVPLKDCLPCHGPGRPEEPWRLGAVVRRRVLELAADMKVLENPHVEPDATSLELVNTWETKWSWNWWSGDDWTTGGWGSWHWKNESWEDCSWSASKATPGDDWHQGALGHPWPETKLEVNDEDPDPTVSAAKAASPQPRMPDPWSLDAARVPPAPAAATHGGAPDCALHVAGGTTEVEAQVFQTSPTSLASRELTLEVDDFLLRGVSLSTCLSQWGKHWSTHGADGGQYESQKSSDYEKSFQVPKYDHFLSHDWKTSRAAKVWSMFFVFNLPAATLASQICAIVVGLVRESEALWAPSHGAPHQLTTSLVPWLVFWLFFCFWQRLRSLLGRPLIVFLDRLCIAQHDPRLKEKGILGLSAFLDKSQSLTILWSKRYFTRLWCSYEVATFLRKESTSVANEQTDKSLTVFPVAMSWILILCFVEVSLVQVFQLYISWWSWQELMLGVPGTDVWDASITSSLGYGAIVWACSLPVMGYWMIGLLQEVRDLEPQLEKFDIRSSDSFCCSHDHKHPKTQETLPCDRDLIYAMLKDWYGTDGDVHEEHLERLNHAIHKQLKRWILHRLDSAVLPRRTIFLLMLSAIAPKLCDAVTMVRDVPLLMPFLPADVVAWHCFTEFYMQWFRVVLAYSMAVWSFFILGTIGVRLLKWMSQLKAAVVLSLPLIAAVVAWEGLLHAVVYLTEKPGNLWGFNWLFGAALWLVLAAGLFCAKCSRLTSLG
ncbi:unnamed protein product [Durusdinium trenchii]|uniref:Uncharacterized protein n=1 Tax=Durusdinium trenchii TaxID=1381693 RepID=A0ABP0MLV1_9DINO